MSVAQPEYVLVRYDKLRHISMQIRDLYAGKYHQHGALELGLVLDGTATLRCETAAYTIPAGGIFLVNPYEPHTLCMAQDTPARVLTVWLSHNFGREYFTGIANTVFEQHVVSEELNAQLRQQLLDAADSYFRELPESQLICVGTLSHLMAALLHSLPHKLSTDAQKAIRKKRTDRVQRIAAYLDQRYRERISLSQLAEAEGLTPAYMSRVFTELFGVSFQEYLNLLRLEQAIPLVLDPAMYLMDVCMECGFSDTRYLNAVFQKEFGCSALEYRQQWQNGDCSRQVEELQQRRTQFVHGG